MNFYVLKDLYLSLKVTVMCYFQKVYEHFNPKIISWIWLKDYGGDIMSKFFNYLDKMF